MTANVKVRQSGNTISPSQARVLGHGRDWLDKWATSGSIGVRGRPSMVASPIKRQQAAACVHRSLLGAGVNYHVFPTMVEPLPDSV